MKPTSITALQKFFFIVDTGSLAGSIKQAQ